MYVGVACALRSRSSPTEPTPFSSPDHPSPNTHPSTAVSETLYVYLQEDPGLPSSSTVASAPSSSSSSTTASPSPSPTAPELRVYLSELYGQLWDVCYLHRNLQLDVRIIYNTTTGAIPPSEARKGKGKGAAAALTTPAAASGPITREEALLKPDLEAVFSRRSPEGELANARRSALVRVLSLVVGEKTR